MRKFSILIVDEDNENMAVLASRLSRDGRSLVVTNCTGEACRIIEEQPIDMLILDTGAGKHCGFEFMRRVFPNTKFASIPVFMMSNRNDLATKLMSYTCGALRFFTKPLDLDEILTSVERFEIKRNYCIA